MPWRRRGNGLKRASIDSCTGAQRFRRRNFPRSLGNFVVFADGLPAFVEGVPELAWQQSCRLDQQHLKVQP